MRCGCDSPGTSWSPYENPSMAGGITTTGNDFEQMLQRLLTYKVLDKTILDQMETDWSQAPVSPSGDGWFGHYGMGTLHNIVQCA